ncbi:unnamed protein product [Owenia fusiformis]|uniref:CUB domain-containing protein n=1 Tax=Owenia fusiformis TaxID=6347 RepID=A0A8S4PNV3_OWEFU|nr:unnamed protein product [Owenia fusiformis]
MLHRNGWKCIPKAPEFKDSCGGTFSEIRGKIRSSTEPYSDCVWHIQVKPKYRVTLIFTKFDVSSEHGCNENYVEVLVGNKDSKGKFCGMKNPPPIISSSSGIITIHLHTDPNSVYFLPYFSAKYEASLKQPDRCYDKITGEGNITSPAFPKRYSSFLDCTWKISARKNQHVRLFFDVFDLEPTKQCLFDYVEIRDGRNKLSPLIGRYCGSRTPTANFTSSGRHMWVSFVSDNDGSGLGFLAYYFPVPIANKTPDTSTQQELIH